jgi:hypothetical protein
VGRFAPSPQQAFSPINSSGTDENELELVQEQASGHLIATESCNKAAQQAVPLTLDELPTSTKN